MKGPSQPLSKKRTAGQINTSTSTSTAVTPRKQQEDKNIKLLAAQMKKYQQQIESQPPSKKRTAGQLNTSTSTSTSTAVTPRKQQEDKNKKLLAEQKNKYQQALSSTSTSTNNVASRAPSRSPFFLAGNTPKKSRW